MPLASSSNENEIAQTRNVSSTSSRCGRVKPSMSRSLPAASSSLRSSSFANESSADSASPRLNSALLVELRLRPDRDHARVRARRFRPAPRHEEHLAAAELGLRAVLARRVALDEFIQRRECLVVLLVGLVGAGQLVEHRIVALVVRIGREQLRVEQDRVGGVERRTLREVLLDAIDLAGLELQVAEPAHCLGTQCGIAFGEVEERRVVFAGAVRAAADGIVRANLDLPLVEVGDGRRLLLRRRLDGRGRDQRRAGDRDAGAQAVHFGSSGDCGAAGAAGAACFCSPAAARS
jgi:hypothetical protein